VTVVAPIEAGEPSVAESDGVRIERGFTLGWNAIAQACRRALDVKASVVHIQHELFLYGGMASIAGLFKGLLTIRKHRRVAVVTAHQVIKPEEVDRSFIDLHRVRAPVTAVRHGLHSFQQTLGALSTRVIVHEKSFAPHVPNSVVIPHGIELRDRVDKASARALLGLDGGFVAMCFGFVAPYKGLENALLATDALPNVQLVIAGGDHPRLAGRDNYARDLRLTWSKKAMFTGYIDDADVALWVAAADLVLLPYPRPHASSGALALALAYGRPFLVSPRLGLFVEAPPEAICPIDPCVLGRRLRELADDRAALTSLADACHRMAAGRSWPEVGRRHVQLYEEVLSAARAAHRAAELVRVRR
jgi:glycosyltransferase involved in cell wall biosynthesis